MPMTKKERQVFDILREELRIAKAFCRTPEVLPDVPPPTDGFRPDRGLTKGFLPVSPGYAPRIEVACSSTVGHGVGRTNMTGIKEPIHLFSTKLLALRALRHQTERIYAKGLADIDRQIEKEIADPTPPLEPEGKPVRHIVDVVGTVAHPA